jgi:hypothetical protein
MGVCKRVAHTRQAPYRVFLKSGEVVIARRFVPKQSPWRRLITPSEGDCGSGCVRTQLGALLRCAPEKLSEGDAASCFLEKQPPGRAGDCFASLLRNFLKATRRAVFWRSSLQAVQEIASLRSQ